MRKVSFPRVGIYTEVGVKFFRSLGLEVIEPKPVGKKILEKGVLHSPEMMCLPYKIVLSSFIQALEEGADTLVMYNSQGFCRFRCYYVLAETALRDMGYKFEMVVPKAKNLFSWVFKLAPGFSPGKIIKIVKQTWDDIRRVEEEDRKKNKGDINIGIVGEFYTCIEPSANLNLVSKLRNYGANVDIGLNVVEFIKHGLKLDIFSKRKEKKEHLKFQASSVFDVVVRWLIYLAFIQAAVSVLNIETLTFLMSEVMIFIANVVIAAVIILVAYGIGVYIKEHIIGRGTSYSDMTGKIVVYFVTFVGLALGLNIVFPGKTTLINGILLLIVGGISLGIAIALGLGLKDIVREMAKDYAKEFRKMRK